jgi:hypothetical protein
MMSEYTFIANRCYASHERLSRVSLSSSRGDSHPPAPDPDVTVSRHPTPVTQPSRNRSAGSVGGDCDLPPASSPGPSSPLVHRIRTAEQVRAALQTNAAIESALAETSAINLELLRRGLLS